MSWIVISLLDDDVVGTDTFESREGSAAYCIEMARVHLDLDDGEPIPTEYIQDTDSRFTIEFDTISWIAIPTTKEHIPLFVIIEEQEEGAINVWGPYDDPITAQREAFMELLDTTGIRSDGEIYVEEESREGPWRISTDFHHSSWAVAQVNLR